LHLVLPLALLFIGVSVVKFEVISVIACANPVRPGDILDTEDVNCPLTKEDLLRFAVTGDVLAIAQTPASGPEVPEARGKKSKETR
jgi:hypothetical protein